MFDIYDWYVFSHLLLSRHTLVPPLSLSLPLLRLSFASPSAPPIALMHLARLNLNLDL